MKNQCLNVFVLNDYGKIFKVFILVIIPIKQFIPFIVLRYFIFFQFLSDLIFNKLNTSRCL